MDGDGGSQVRIFAAWGTPPSVPAGNEWLTAAEREVHAALTFPKRAADWRLGRWIAKEAVRRALGDPSLHATAVEILASESGAPRVEVLGRGERPSLCVSLSHAWGMGFAAATLGPAGVGCDVEAVRPRSEAFVSDYFTAPEAERVHSVPETERATWANLLWSAKESGLKVLREGLRRDTRSVEVSVTEAPAGGGWFHLDVVTSEGIILPGLWRVMTGFVWTLVADRAVGHLEAAPVG